MEARKVSVTITYDTTDITTYISPYLKSLSYQDHLSGQADDLQLTLMDIDGLWQSTWMPDKGATLDVTLSSSSWRSAGETGQKLHVGAFEIDEITTSGYPSEVQIKAVSVPDDNTLRGEDHTRSWEKAELKTIATDIASNASLELFYDTEDNPVIERAEQTEQSDLSFLMSLCGDHGLALKIADKQVTIFDEAAYEAEDAVITLVKPGTSYTQATDMIYITDITSYSLGSKLRDIYAACHVSYQEGKDNAVIDCTFTAEGKTGKTLQVREQVTSTADALRLAKKRLRDKNKDEITGSFTLPGSFYLVAGINVMLQGFGAFDGKYIIHEATHNVGGGYTTNISIRRCLDGY